MNLTLHYHGQMVQAVGRDCETFPCPEGHSVPELLRKVVELHGDSVRAFLFDSAGRPSKCLLITVNDTMVDPATAPALRAGDEVALLPPIAGG